MTDDTNPPQGASAGNGAPLPNEADDGAGLPPADEALELPGDIDMGESVAPDDDDGQYGHTQEVIEPEAKPNGDAAELGEWDAGDDSAPIPPRGWLLGNIFCRGFVSSLIAEGGAGKTALRTAQALALTSGRPITGEHVFQRCRVLIVSLEDDMDELRRRPAAPRYFAG